MGDLDGDGDNDFADFRLFQADYIAANGAAAFDALLNVPEPATALLLLSMFGASTRLFVGENATSRVDWRAPKVMCSDWIRSCGHDGISRSTSRQPDILPATNPPACIAGDCCGHLRDISSLGRCCTETSIQFHDRTINDSVGGANGTVVDAGTTPDFNFTGGRLDLSIQFRAGSSAITEDAYVDLPNGIILRSLTPERARS